MCNRKSRITGSWCHWGLPSFCLAFLLWLSSGYRSFMCMQILQYPMKKKSSISFSSFLFLWRKVFTGNSPGNYLQIPLARIGHMSVPEQWQWHGWGWIWPAMVLSWFFLWGWQWAPFLSTWLYEKWLPLSFGKSRRMALVFTSKTLSKYIPPWTLVPPLIIWECWTNRLPITDYYHRVYGLCPFNNGVKPSLQGFGWLRLLSVPQSATALGH